MSEQGAEFFEKWVRTHLREPSSNYLQNSVKTNKSHLLAEAEQSGIERVEIEAEVGDIHLAIFEAMMKVLDQQDPPITQLRGFQS